MYTNKITLVLFYSFSKHLNIGVQIVRILSSWGSWFYDSSSILMETISGPYENPHLLLVQSMHLQCLRSIKIFNESILQKRQTHIFMTFRSQQGFGVIAVDYIIVLGNSSTNLYIYDIVCQFIFIYHK